MPDPIIVAQHGDIECRLLPGLANRHGVITGEAQRMALA